MDACQCRVVAARHDESCCCGPGLQRRYVSTKEKLEQLEAYKTEISKELAGIEEAIKKLRKE
jgi:hypothetical protein